jgi:hypothetical protein
MTISQQSPDLAVELGTFVFLKKARVFPVVDALPLRWPASSADADELIELWRSRAGQALAGKRLSKKTMDAVASHTSRKTGKCPLSDRSISSRADRSIPSVKRDICRLKKMGFLIAEVVFEDGYRKRRRLLQLAVPDVIDEDQRIPSDDDQRIPPADNTHWGSTYPLYVDPTDKGVRRDD